ncbi:MAG: type II toxin-antitoxin system VapC family toxin [Verrucomicrobiota bacterium]
MKTVYLETSFVSYLVSEPGRDVIVAGHQAITREWWQFERHKFTCFVSQVVRDEASLGDAEQVRRRLDAIAQLAELPALPAAESLTMALVESGVFPAKAVRDAAHVAIAAAAGVDYVLTWNCKHLANEQVRRRAAEIVAARRLQMPKICTPEELLSYEEKD